MAFRVFEHTADIGLEVEAVDLEGLFREAALGLFSVIRGDNEVADLQTRDVVVEADRLDRVLVDWLEEFIFLQDADGLVFRTVDDVKVEPEADRIRVSAVAHAEPFSHERHPGCLHVKAITWHGLEVTGPRGGEPARARIILDI